MADGRWPNVINPTIPYCFVHNDETMYKVHTVSVVNLKRCKSNVENNILQKVFKEKKINSRNYSGSSLHRLNGYFCQFILNVSKWPKNAVERNSNGYLTTKIFNVAWNNWPYLNLYKLKHLHQYNCRIIFKTTLKLIYHSDLFCFKFIPLLFSFNLFVRSMLKFGYFQFYRMLFLPK